MDFKIVLAIIVLCALKISCQVSLVRNFDLQECIIEETVITLTCTVEDRNNGNGATVINGSQSIFDCPSVSKVENNKLYLRHSHMESATATCGELVSGRIVEVQNGTYITQIYIATNVSMNEGYVECRDFGQQGSSQIQLANIEALPRRPTLYVEFLDNLFHIHWNQYEDLTKSSDSHFSIEVTGEDCGNCTNLNEIVSNVTNQLSCTGWEPNGQVCNVTVTAVASVCGLQQFISSSRLVYLRVPEAPLLKDLMPAYSLDLEELQSMQILLAVESTVDLNGLPIAFQVSVNRSSDRWDNNPKCSLKIFANSKCIANADALVQYHCEINFPVSSCQELFLQPEQDADYQIGIFAESSIGRSSLNFSNIPSYARLTVQFLFSDPQQSPQIYNFISVNFLQLYDNVTSMIRYGSNCQALDNQMTIVGFNVTTLTFPVPGTMDNICWIVTISNISKSLAFQGNFSAAVDLNSPDAYQVSFDYSISAVAAAAFVLFIITYTPAVTWYTRRKYSKYTINIQTNSDIKSELLSNGAEHDIHKTNNISN